MTTHQLQTILRNILSDHISFAEIVKLYVIQLCYSAFNPAIINFVPIQKRYDLADLRDFLFRS